MDWTAVLARLNDLPATYTRPGDVFSWLQASIGTGLHRLTNANDGVLDQLDISNANGKWLDTWGRLFNFPRNDSESDADYLARIKFLLLLPGGPPNAILQFVQLVEKANATLAENFSNASFSISLSSGLPSSRYNQLANDLRFVRPAGVPFQVNILRGGLFLNTLNYIATAPRVTGAYLISPVTPFPYVIPQNTNNATATLPTTFLTDPILNPGL